MEVKLSAPWEIYVKKLRKLLELDRRVEFVRYVEERHAIEVGVVGDEKAKAMEATFVPHVEFGNVAVDIVFVPSNGEQTEADLLQTAFESNKAFHEVCRGKTPHGVEADFALFAPDVVQVFADDLTSPFGLQTYTYEQLARELLVQNEVRISSDALH